MSMMLNFITTTLEHGRRLQDLGRTSDAIAALERLVGLEALTRPMAEEVQIRLAELQIDCQNFRVARRHLLVALAYHPTNARYHHLLALALEADNHCQPARAVRHYVQSLRLNAKQPLCLHDLGCLRIQLGQVNAGLRLLSQAVRLAPDEPRYLEALAWALLDAGKASLAWKFVLRARFQQRNDPRFADVLKRFRFAAVRSEQAGPQAVEPITLPFVPVPPKPPTGTGKRRGRLVRLDRASRPKPHFFAWKADSRRLS